MSDRLIRAICRNAEIKFTAVCTTETVERARQIHKTLPLATAALGRTLSAASMMGRELKDKNGSVTIQIKGNGRLAPLPPLATVTAVCAAICRILLRSCRCCRTAIWTLAPVSAAAI